MQQPAPQPVQQPLFQQPQAAPEPVAARQEYQQPAPQAQPNYAAAAPQARPVYQTAQPRPPVHGATAPQPSYQARAAAPQYQEEPRQQRSSGFNGFNIFGRPKPAAREEQWDERPEPSAKSITQTQPLFGDEFDDEIEIPTFLRKQAN
jgi:cell division protein FtsZ